MPYYIRVLSPSESIIPVSELSRSLKKCTLVLEEGTDTDWKQILLMQSNGEEVAVVERNVVNADSLGQEEIQDFLEGMDNLKPRSGADWLKAYLPTVKTIYAFQVLGQTKDSGWSAIGSLKGKLWNALGGIFQADGEGFSNEAGYHIVWQFSDSVSGTWWMGLLRNGNWVHFEMNLGKPSHRSQFLDGQVPEDVKFVG